MIEINGTSVYNALAMGKLHFLCRTDNTVKRTKVSDPSREISRFHESKRAAHRELEQLYAKALREVGETNAQIFEIHRLMLDDEDFGSAIENMIETQLVNAEYATQYTADIFAKNFEEMDDEYMRARAADVRDIARRLLRILGGNAESSNRLSESVIIVADDLSPSETVQLDKDKILGFVTFKGSRTSHTAILAGTMNIPALIGTGEIDPCHDGELAILDGHSSTLYINPDEDKTKDFKLRKALDDERARLLQELRGKDSVTKSGRKVNIYANIGSPSDVASVIQNDADGIGLFRSEFIYLGQNDFPTEDEQFVKYKEVLEKMGGKKVIVRTLDIGADKKIDYFNLPEEENPALGFRAIRICLSRREIFRTQLRALLRASAFGNLSVMFPMIISPCEVREALSLLDEARTNLADEGIPTAAKIEVGIMIETPAAAVICDLLAPLVDFFSIGTNDLTQYTLALDRQNRNLDKFYDPHHPAILRMIERVAQAAHSCGKWVGICGELACDTALTEKFVEWGIDELSVSPSYVLGLREKVRGIE